MLKITCGGPVELCRMVIETLWFRDFASAAAAWNTRNPESSRLLPSYNILPT